MISVIVKFYIMAVIKFEKPITLVQYQSKYDCVFVFEKELMRKLHDLDVLSMYLVMV